MRPQEESHLCHKMISLSQLVGFIAWIYVGTGFFQFIHNFALLLILNEHTEKQHQEYYIEDEDNIINCMPYAFMVWYTVQLGASVVLYKGVVERHMEHLMKWMIIISAGAIFQLTCSVYLMTSYPHIKLVLTILFRIFSLGMDVYSVCTVYSLYVNFKERLWDPPIII